MYRAVLRNELLGTSIDGISHSSQSHSLNSNNNNNNQGNSLISSSSSQSKFMTVLQPREMTSVFQVCFYFIENYFLKYFLHLLYFLVCEFSF